MIRTFAAQLGHFRSYSCWIPSEWDILDIEILFPYFPLFKNAPTGHLQPISTRHSQPALHISMAAVYSEEVSTTYNLEQLGMRTQWGHKENHWKSLAVDMVDHSGYSENHCFRTYCIKNFRGWIAGFSASCRLIEIRTLGYPGIRAISSYFL